MIFDLMNKNDIYFFKTLEIPERVSTFYFQGKTYTREELLEIQNNLNEKN